MSKRDEILPLFPLKIREMLAEANIDFAGLCEIRLRVNQPVMLRCGLREERQLFSKEDGKAPKTPYLVTPQDVRDTVELISRHSLYAFEEDVKRGFLTVPGGHRVGIAGRVVMDGGRVAALRNISFLNIRISHEVPGCAEAFLPYIIRKDRTDDSITNEKCVDDSVTKKERVDDSVTKEERVDDSVTKKERVGERVKKRERIDESVTKKECVSDRVIQSRVTEDIYHTLILSGPGGGKTTLLRDLVRLLSYAGKNVSVIDERSEIAGCYQGIPENDLGPRTDVLDGCPKAVGCRMALRSLAPDVIAVDELGGREDLDALAEAAACGCRVIATMHASGMEDLRARPFFKEMSERKTFERFLVRNTAVPSGHREAWRAADGNGTWIGRFGG